MAMFEKTLLIQYLLLCSPVIVLCEFYKECQDQEVGVFVAHLKNCTQYIYCNDMDSLLGDCPVGHYFNPVQSFCEVNDGLICKTLYGQKDEQTSTTDAVIVTTTQNDSNSLPATTATIDATTTTTITTITEVSTTPTTLPTTAHIFTHELTDMLKPVNANQRPSCQPTIEQTFAHPQRCEYYYKCIRGFLTILRCSLQHGWDVERQVCVPIKEAKCANSLKRIQ